MAIKLTLLLLEPEYSGFGVNTMRADVMAPKVAKSKIRFKM